MVGVVVELRSLFLGGRTGDDAQLSQSDDSPESGLDRFSPISFGDRSSADASDGDAGTLGRWWVSTGVGQDNTQLRCHSLKVSIFALQVLVFLFKFFPFRPHVEHLLPRNFCDAIDDSGMKVGAAFPCFAVSAQNGILCAQL